MNKKRLLRGLCVSLSFFSALFLTLELIATSSSDYKSMVDGVFGVNNSAAGGGSATYKFPSEYESTTELYTHRKQIAEQLAADGSVLLKNKNDSLPLAGGNKKVTILGSRAFTYTSSGTLRDTSLATYGGIVGSPIRQQTVTVEDGTYNVPITLEDALTSRGIEVNPSSKNVYSNLNYPSLPSGSEANGQQGGPFSINEPYVEASDFENTDQYSDAAIVVIGRASGEGREYFPGQNGIADKSDGSKSSLNLSDNERNLIRQAKQISDNVIVLVNSAVAMEISELRDGNELGDLVSSVMWTGIPGSYGMNGVADIISGKTSPSGHLPDTYAVDASASPAAQNYGVSAVDGSGDFVWENADEFGGVYKHADNYHYVVLAEDIYTGYYYYETRYNDVIENRGNAQDIVGSGREGDNQSWKYENEVVYPFGYGLSYSEFSYEFVADENGAMYSYDPEDKSLTFNVKVTNVGDYAAKDAVQLYVSSPYTQYDIDHGVEKSAIQLITFDKTQTLYPLSEASEEKPNSEVVTLKADLKYFASYDKTAEHDGKTGGYILEDGDYYFSIGNGAHQALNNVLAIKNPSSVDKLYSFDNQTIDTALAMSWNPALEAGLTSQDGGSFVGSVNATLLNTSEEGVITENQLEDADYNYFKDNTVTYLSRNNWKDTFPISYTSEIEITEEMRKYLGTDDSNGGRVYSFTSGGSSGVNFGVDHSLDEDADGNPLENKSIAEYKGKAYDDEEWDYLLEQITFDEAWQFSPYGGTSCKPFKSVNAPEVWQIDGPNGNVTRSVSNKAPTSGYLSISKNDPNANYMSCDMPVEPLVAATFDQDLIEEEGKIYGEDGIWSRNQIQWAPGMNLHRTPFNSRNHEYYSEDPMLTNILGTAFVRGGLSKGMILAAKHFAFNTQESYREGLTQFMEEQSAREMELRAFQGLAEDVEYVNDEGNEINALGLMTSFSRIGCCGVNAHTGLMKNILRGEWGYKGLISTDMVVGGRFFNPQDSIINNVTFMATSNAENLLKNSWPDYNDKNKVRNDPNLCKALYENMHHYMYALANSSALNGYDADTVIVADQKSSWEYMLIGLSSGFGGLALVSIGGIVFFTFYKKKDDLETEVSQGGDEHAQ